MVLWQKQTSKRGKDPTLSRSSWLQPDWRRRRCVVMLSNACFKWCTCKLTAKQDAVFCLLPRSFFFSSISASRHGRSARGGELTLQLLSTATFARSLPTTREHFRQHDYLSMHSPLFCFPLQLTCPTQTSAPLSKINFTSSTFSVFLLREEDRQVRVSADTSSDHFGKQRELKYKSHFLFA